jgi:RNA polymerase sigma factor (TIGR02999 family)
MRPEVEADTRQTEAGTVTRLLSELEGGNDAALDALYPIIYDELRAIARSHRRRWDGDTTLGTTALVHEAFLKLSRADEVHATSRLHFLRVASRAMRQILSNYARDRRAIKRGSEAAHVPLDLVDAENRDVAQHEHLENIENLEEALKKLEAFDKRLSDVVECRFFGGMSIEDTAAALQISPATVKRDWALAHGFSGRSRNNALSCSGRFRGISS